MAQDNGITLVRYEKWGKWASKLDAAREPRFFLQRPIVFDTNHLPRVISLETFSFLVPNIVPFYSTKYNETAIL